MSTAELKEKLIEELNKIEDEDFLNDALGLFRDRNKGRYVLSPEQVAMVKEAHEQYERGEFLSEEEANREADQWLED